MKKLAYLLVVMFVAAIGANTYASHVITNNNGEIVVVTPDFDKKPCPADCKGECCKADKSADAKSTSKTTDKASCDKSAKKSCDSKSDAKSSAKKATGDKK